jgi:heat shock protein beta
LKQDAQEFAEEHTIKELVKKYSEFINFPIYMKTVHDVTREVESEEDEEEEGETSSSDEVEVSDDEDKERAPKRTVTER